MERALDSIRKNEPRMLELWRRLVRLESPSSHKPGVDAVAEVLADFCRRELSMHLRFREDPVYGRCLAACSCPFEEYRHGIALSAHMDTVHPLGSFRPLLREDETYLYGPGAGDCKGGIILCLLTALALKEMGYRDRPIKLLFAGDEESGGPSGRDFYPRELEGSDYLFNAESGLRETLVTGRKASLIAVYDITGAAAHIGYLPGKPVSALREGALKLLALEDASDYEDLTFCAGKLTGGTVATGVPDRCHLEVNVRIRSHAGVEKALALLRQQAEISHVPGTQCALTVRGLPFPMEERPENLELAARFRDASRDLGFGDFRPAFVGGASDAAHASAMGIPVICATGPVVDFQHTLRERVEKASMAQRAMIHVSTVIHLPKKEVSSI